MTKPAAIYARVSSDRQKEDHTIGSQLAALIQYADEHGYMVPPEWRFQDEGYSGGTLVRPGLEALRDLAAAGQIEAALVYSPDRLSRKYAYQVLLTEELSRGGVAVVFLKAPSGATAEDQLLVQFQGMIAEYERAQIAERSRRARSTLPDSAYSWTAHICGRRAEPPTRFLRPMLSSRRAWATVYSPCSLASCVAAAQKAGGSFDLAGCVARNCSNCC